MVNKEYLLKLQAGGPVPFDQLPTKNRISIINNYSPTYDYIVEDDKIYKSIKGKNQWIEISENEVARRNLLNFIHDKYNFRGYEDNERKIYDMMTKENVVDYSSIRKRLQQQKSDQLKQKLSIKAPEQQQHEELPSSLYVHRPYGMHNGVLVTPDNAHVEKRWDQKVGEWFDDMWTLFQNWRARDAAKNSDSDEAVSKLRYEETYQDPNSKYSIQPESFTGDTIYINKNANPREYYLPESINLNDVRLGTRNRGDNRPIQSEGAIITSLKEFLPYSKVSNKNATYIGVDSNGRFKAGPYSDFREGDIMAQTWANNVESFVTDAHGKILTKDDGPHGNPGRRVPRVNVIGDDGKRVEGSINLLTNKKDTNTGTYGAVTGGRVIMRAGNETRLVSGSIDNIREAFEDLKRRNNVPYVTFYTLDNGTFNRGLRMSDNRFTERDLRNHDLKNSGGGNFMYLLSNPEVYRADTTFTKNVRTAQDESYKKGHPLKNQLKGIVNHHTGMYPGGVQEVLRDFENSHGTDNARSAHVVIDEQGNRHILARPEQVTFHGGFSRWAGQNNVNDFMLGVEFLGDTNQKDLTPEQIQSYVEYVKPIIRQYQIPFENIATHQQVRDEYNKWAKANGEREAASKPDINMSNQSRILDELLRQVYIKK